jgi:hypothetical protein
LQVHVLLLFFFAACAASPAWSRVAPCTAAASCRAELALAGGGKIGYYRSLPLASSDAVERAVVVVHGDERNADDYFSFAIAAARSERRLDDTLVLAPGFRAAGDNPSAGEHFWSSGGWKVGDRSRDAARVSSFAVMDDLLARICGRNARLFPRLRTAVIAGHSAGGQFVSRYVAGGAGCANPAVEVRYVVMNPSSYLYVDGRRRSAAGARFAAPASGCSDYDDYKYGLRELNAYMSDVGAAEIRRRLFTRRTWFVAGLTDTGTDSKLDVRCAAQLQGRNRLERFANYRDYAGLFPDWTGATFVTVPRTGHSGRRMLASEQARAIMFR